MAPFPSLPGQDWATTLSRSIGTPTINIPSIVRRQSPATATVTVVINNDNGNHAQTLSGGAIAGIIIGSVIGILLLIWIIRSCFNLGAPPQEREKWYRDQGNTKRHRHRSRSNRRTSSVNMPPPVVIRAERSRSRHHSRSPNVIYTSQDRGRSGRYYEER
ncbi:hypothetical protein G7046_g2864 [Stylonectria norvegica]|nr:hypothetical protein G7046_g2864 [Stylonectria norvegica]